MVIQNQALSDELLVMSKADQEMRMKSINDGRDLDSSVDERNQERLESIIDEHGWPTIAKVGVEASNAAWLIVQHAPDLKFMERCLNIMESLKPGEVNPANIAYLKDRVLMHNGKPQIYGTQFQGFGKDIKVYPIDDVENVDKRRKSVGLGSFAKYESKLRGFYAKAK